MLDFPMNLLVGRETQSLLPTAFIMLPDTANHFDRAATVYMYMIL